MVFKKKGYIRSKEDNRLLELLEQLKYDLMVQQDIVRKSVDPSPVVLTNLKIIETKYFFLLREARKRGTTM
ncbi:YaaL family protein [Alkalihalobacillus sp. LMS39]|uniref:YaaL family protein n=1 Tax=Alkalihalobacillus sp. LMS39 TaxID=2924032 RepID=UPI001FB3D5F7|nr:YaaL family protein [Alkalihalobacillus sp. LMS39]UOE94166.1 YaaL family protein [Alkalihalobacillus sp. LMS39]